MKVKKFRKLIIIGIFFFTVIVIFSHNVSKKITEEDIDFIEMYLPDTIINQPNENYQTEVSIIKGVQLAVLTHNPIGPGIPHNEKREPKNLYNFDGGLCFDRSRVIEKCLMALGFETRHVALFKDSKGQSTLKELLGAKTPSHAITEVKTSKGWLIVDSNHLWLGLDQEENPHSMSQLNDVNWLNEVANGSEKFYIEPCHYIYGLYSRHGHFYPPYNFIPDYNIRELLYNIGL